VPINGPKSFSLRRLVVGHGRLLSLDSPFPLFPTHGWRGFILPILPVAPQRWTASLAVFPHVFLSLSICPFHSLRLYWFVYLSSSFFSVFGRGFDQVWDVAIPKLRSPPPLMGLPPTLFL